MYFFPVISTEILVVFLPQCVVAIAVVPEGDFLACERMTSFQRLPIKTGQYWATLKHTVRQISKETEATQFLNN